MRLTACMQQNMQLSVSCEQYMNPVPHIMHCYLLVCFHCAPAQQPGLQVVHIHLELALLLLL